LASSIDHDEGFRAEVEKGRASANEGRMVEHSDVVSRMDRHDIAADAANAPAVV
jgi:predicted transcriptional regulator